MRHLGWLLVLLLASVATASYAGDIQVICEPGLRVYLDGKLAGTSTTNDDGLFLADVAGGTHAVRVEKDGFVPQSFEVKVEKLPVEVKVGEFVAEPPKPLERPTARPQVTEAPGSLVVISAPQNCSVEVDGKPELKTVPVLRIEGVAAGEHTITFSRPGYDPVSRVITVESGADVTIRGDLKAKKVETIYEGKGALQVYSTPEHCGVRFLGKTYDKTDPKLNVTYIPAGTHRLEVSWNGRIMSKEILIIKGQRTVVTVSFLEGAEPFVISYTPW